MDFVRVDGRRLCGCLYSTHSALPFYRLPFFFSVFGSMSELSKMEEAEEQGFLEDVDILQTPEEHAKNLAILKDQKGQRKKWVMPSGL